jgi:predicted transcriptional regulator
MWFRRFIRAKKETIQLELDTVSVDKDPKTLQSLRERLLYILQQCDIDLLIKNPVAAMSILTMYTSSWHELVQETLTPSRNRALIGVSLYSFFKDSHLPPSLVMERLASLFVTEPASIYARFDIEILINELHDLSDGSSRSL